VIHRNQAKAMNNSKDKPRYQGVDRRAPRADASAPAGSRDGFANTLKREKVGGRHGAITTSLYSWHSYKNWADKVRGNWDEKK